MRVGQPWLCYTRLSLLRKTLANQGVPSLDGQGFPKRLQPPSGGCVLKLNYWVKQVDNAAQPPSGGCVLKRYTGCRFASFVLSRLRAAVC